ncbi:MAG: ABC transporter permease [Clostridia bacterium]|nr:ABC transporter permease [Clostridia bacterium]
MKTTTVKSNDKSFFQKPAVQSVVASLICILGGLLVGFLVLLFMAIFSDDISVGEAFSGIFIVLSGPIAAGNPKDILFSCGNMLFTATPLIMTGLAIALAFKTGLFNIGAPGQYLMGAMGSLVVSLSIPQGSMPSWLIWTLAFLTGTVLGVLWGAIPGFFKAKFNVNEVIVCILTNWIAANVVSWVFYANQQNFVNFAETKTNFIKKTSANGVSTWTMGLDKLFGGSYLDVSIILVTLIAVMLYIMLNKTTFGYELKACGYNRNASKYAGMNEKRNIILSMAIAGGLAAAGAALWCLNGQQDFKWNTYQQLPSVGFNGIPAALLASNNPIGVVFSAIFLRYIDTGGSYLNGKTSFNEYVPQLIVAVIIYFAGFSKLIKDFLGRKKKNAVPAPSPLLSGQVPAAALKPTPVEPETEPEVLPDPEKEDLPEPEPEDSPEPEPEDLQEPAPGVDPEKREEGDE